MRATLDEPAVGDEALLAEVGDAVDALGRVGTAIDIDHRTQVVDERRTTTLREPEQRRDIHHGGEYRSGYHRNVSVAEGSGPRPMGSTSEIRWWWSVAAAIVLPLTRLLFRRRVMGAERLPSHGPGILAANHVSMLDGPIVCIPPWRRGRMVRFLAAAEYFDVPVVGWALRTVRQIPIRRGEQDIAALAEAIATIRAGAFAGVFPEGHVNHDPEGDLQRIRTGIARIALATGATVYPIGIWGTQHRFPRGGIRWARPLRPALTLAVGDPVRPPVEVAPGDQPRGEDVEDVTVAVAAALRAAVETARSDAEARS